MGGHTRVEGQMGVFSDYLTNYELSDLGYSSPHFTWCKNCKGAQQTLEKTDCALANFKWCT